MLTSIEAVQEHLSPYLIMLSSREEKKKNLEGSQQYIVRNVGQIIRHVEAIEIDNCSVRGILTHDLGDDCSGDQKSRI